MSDIAPQACDLIIEAGWVVPVVPHGVVLEDHAVVVSGGRIQAVLPTAEARQRFSPEATASRPEAALVTVSSMGALAPVPGQTVYGASKSAVKLLTEGLYAEAMGTNLAVTIVFPGGVSTDITGNSGVEMCARASARVALQKSSKSSGSTADVT